MLRYICFTFKEFETKYPIFLKEYLGQYEDNTEVFLLNKLKTLYSNCVSYTENPSILKINILTKLKDNEFDLLKKKLSTNKIIVEYRQNTDGYIRYAEKTLFEKIRKDHSSGGYVFTVISEKNINEHLFTIGINGIDESLNDFFNMELAEKYTNSFNNIIRYIDLKIDAIIKNNNSILSNINSNITQTSKDNNTYTFLKKINEEKVTELDMINFIESITNFEFAKLNTLEKDAENFKDNLFIKSVVNDLVVTNEQIEISPLLKKFIDVIKAKIKETNMTEKDISFLNEIWFKVGLKLATGEITFDSKENPSQIAKKHFPEHKTKSGNSARPYITSAINIEYSNDKNIFKSEKKLQQIIDYCKENKISIDPLFKGKIPTNIYLNY